MPGHVRQGGSRWAHCPADDQACRAWPRAPLAPLAPRTWFLAPFPLLPTPSSFKTPRHWPPRLALCAGLLELHPTPHTRVPPSPPPPLLPTHPQTCMNVLPPLPSATGAAAGWCHLPPPLPFTYTSLVRLFCLTRSGVLVLNYWTQLPNYVLPNYQTTFASRPAASWYPTLQSDVFQANRSLINPISCPKNAPERKPGFDLTSSEVAVITRYA